MPKRKRKSVLKKVKGVEPDLSNYYSERGHYGRWEGVGLSSEDQTQKLADAGVFNYDPEYMYSYGDTYMYSDPTPRTVKKGDRTVTRYDAPREVANEESIYGPEGDQSKWYRAEYLRNRHGNLKGYRVKGEDEEGKWGTLYKEKYKTVKTDDLVPRPTETTTKYNKQGQMRKKVTRNTEGRTVEKYAGGGAVYDIDPVTPYVFPSMEGVERDKETGQQTVKKKHSKSLFKKTKKYSTMEDAPLPGESGYMPTKYNPLRKDYKTDKDYEDAQAEYEGYKQTYGTDRVMGWNDYIEKEGMNAEGQEAQQNQANEFTQGLFNLPDNAQQGLNVDLSRPSVGQQALPVSQYQKQQKQNFTNNLFANPIFQRNFSMDTERPNVGQYAPSAPVSQNQQAPTEQGGYRPEMFGDFDPNRVSRFNLGGMPPMGQNGGYAKNLGGGLRKYIGASHEQGGINIDGQGNPIMVNGGQVVKGNVENKETEKDGYIYSDTLKVGKQFRYGGKTFAEASELINKKYMNGGKIKPKFKDKIADGTRDFELNQLRAMNEEARIAKETKDLAKADGIYAKYGAQLPQSRMGGKVPQYSFGGAAANIGMGIYDMVTAGNSTPDTLTHKDIGFSNYYESGLGLGEQSIGSARQMLSQKHDYSEAGLLARRQGAMKDASDRSFISNTTSGGANRRTQQLASSATNNQNLMNTLSNINLQEQAANIGQKNAGLQALMQTQQSLGQMKLHVGGAENQLSLANLANLQAAEQYEDKSIANIDAQKRAGMSEIATGVGQGLNLANPMSWIS